MAVMGSMTLILCAGGTAMMGSMTLILCRGDGHDGQHDPHSVQLLPPPCPPPLPHTCAAPVPPSPTCAAPAPPHTHTSAAPAPPPPPVPVQLLLRQVLHVPYGHVKVLQLVWGQAAPEGRAGRQAAHRAETRNK